jgi:hypothetical protein
MNATRLIACIGIAAVSSGCSIALSESDAFFRNTCGANSDCGADGVCIASTCVSTKADLGALYLEIKVPSSSASIAGTTLVSSSDLGLNLVSSDPGGFIRTQTLTVAEPVKIQSSFKLDRMQLNVACEMTLDTNGNVPFAIELHPTGQPTGIALTPYSATPAAGTTVPSISVPPGSYDVYLQPQLPKESACHVPPAVFRTVSLAGGEVSISVSGGKPTELSGKIDVALLDDAEKTECAKKPNSCWRLQLLDNDSGRAIGTDGELKVDTEKNSTQFSLAYWPPPKEAKPSDPVLVLTPPESQRKKGMPIAYWKLIAVDPDGDNNISLQVGVLTKATNTPVGVEGSVLSEMGGMKVPATVLIRSSKLLKGEFSNAVFETSVETDAAGKFAVQLLPGSYDFVAIPSSTSNYAVTTFTQAFDEQDIKFGKGLTFAVKSLSHVVATAVTPRGEPVANIPVLMTPSRTKNDTLLKLQVEGDLLDSLARSGTTKTDFAGAFKLDVDPGRIDISLRPVASSNLPWLARPQINISASQPQTVDLHQISFTNPVILTGNVRSAKGAALAGVTLRAWLAVAQPGDASGATIAVPIGEANSDSSGRYRLLLPASVAQ